MPQSTFRIRNHPALTVYCGGNEFNPEEIGNTTAIGILERNLKDFDDTRRFLRSTKSAEDDSEYPDKDSTCFQYRDPSGHSRARWESWSPIPAAGIRDENYGARLRASGNVAIWCVESGWKVGRAKSVPTNSSDAIAKCSAKNET